MDLGDSASSDRLLTRIGASSAAEATWRALISSPVATRQDLQVATEQSPAALDGALGELLELQLIRIASTPSGIAAIDPSIAVEMHLAREDRRLAQQAEDLATIRTQLIAVGAEYASGRGTVADQPGFEIVYGRDEIRRLNYLAAEQEQYESRWMTPACTPETIKDTEPTDLASLDRGVRMRSIIGQDAVEEPATYEALRGRAAFGEQFRTLSSIPNQMLTFDRYLAVLAIDPSRPGNGAMFIRIPSLIDMLIFTFDQQWAAADPLFIDESLTDVSSSRRARVLELMAVGSKDERIARMLGVGVRTIRRDVADLKAELGANSRAEILTSAVRRGWL